MKKIKKAVAEGINIYKKYLTVLFMGCSWFCVYQFFGNQIIVRMAWFSNREDISNRINTQMLLQHFDKNIPKEEERYMGKFTF